MIGPQERDQHVATRLEVVEEGAAMPSRSTTTRAHAIVPPLAEEGGYPGNLELLPTCVRLSL